MDGEGGGKHLETMGLHKDFNRESFESLIQSLQTSTLLVKSELTEHRKEKIGLIQEVC